MSKGIILKSMLMVSVMLNIWSNVVVAREKEMYFASSSINESRSHHLLIRTVKVEPEQFMWEGHRVDISESWLEHLTSDKNRLYFKFLIDGGRLNEARLWKRNTLLAFKREDTNSERSISYFINRRFWENLVGGTSGDMVHFMNIDVSDPGPIKLRVGTNHPGIKNNTHPETTWGDKVLTFYISGVE